MGKWGGWLADVISQLLGPCIVPELELQVLQVPLKNMPVVSV